MDDHKLIACFQRVFPQLAEDEIREATMRQLGAWDSSALLRLIAGVEKTFAVRFTPQQLETFISFEEVRQLLTRMVNE